MLTFSFAPLLAVAVEDELLLELLLPPALLLDEEPQAASSAAAAKQAMTMMVRRRRCIAMDNLSCVIADDVRVEVLACFRGSSGSRSR
ncbi:MAG TPA: hypothetical protein VN817_09785 [Solirubrobacteraceae bacterium]|nr:hypothetical protein [Solirubrobacteraceae bacterium]